MHTIEVTKRFATKEACLEYLAALRWPDGVYCMGKNCGVMGNEHFRKFTTKETKRQRYSKKEGKKVWVRVPSRTLYECRECGYQFAATTGTIFHDSHLALEKWFQAVALILEAKKGISALQVCRNLGIPETNYKAIWYLCHRIREAMIEAGILSGVVEADETYLSPRKPRKGFPKRKKQGTDVVLGMVERGGKLKLIPVADAKMTSIEPEIVKHVSTDATLQTDMSLVYSTLGRKRFPGRHRMIDHIMSYGQGENHTNHIENAFSLLKRGVYGTYHHVSIKHLRRYCNEFSYRFNRRGEQKGMFEETMRGLLRGQPLTYKALTASETAVS